jgi:hypothetical protein
MRSDFDIHKQQNTCHVRKTRFHKEPTSGDEAFCDTHLIVTYLEDVSAFSEVFSLY